MSDKRLRNAEYTILRYELRLTEDLFLPAYGLIRLRREFNRILNGGLLGTADHADFRDLLRPPLPVDPALLRRVQQPAPGFIFLSDLLQSQQLKVEDILPLTVCFFGRGILQMELFSRLLDALGEVGLYTGAGRFNLESITCCSDPTHLERLWRGGPYLLTPRILDLSSVGDAVAPSSVAFDLQTPARLLKNKRPLFRPDFAAIFPFILRRVSGMLAAWSNLEEVFEVPFLLDRASTLVETENRLRWYDWRPLHNQEEVGGVIGSVILSGDGLLEIWPVLKIGELFGIGKGAAFGAGRYRLD